MPVRRLPRRRARHHVRARHPRALSRRSAGVLVDKAWPPFDGEGPIGEQHISDEHIYGARGVDEGAGEDAGEDRSYFTTWPIPLHTSKQNLKNRATLRGLKRRLFDRCSGPVLLLAVHLCGTLSLRAVELFNEHPRVRLLALKPLPPYRP